MDVSCRIADMFASIFFFFLSTVSPQLVYSMGTTGNSLQKCTLGQKYFLTFKIYRPIRNTVLFFSQQGWVVASDNINSQTYTVRHLRPDTAYMFLVRARNSHGLSHPSDVSNTVRTKGGSGARPTLPPLDVSEVQAKLNGQVVVLKEAEVLSSTSIKLSWEVSAMSVLFVIATVFVNLVKLFIFK